MLEHEYECMYCGRRFMHYQTYYSQEPRCPCGETKTLRDRGTKDKTKGDIFGYRYDPKTSKKPKTQASQAGHVELQEASHIGSGDRPGRGRLQVGLPQEEPGSPSFQREGTQADLHRDGHRSQDRRAGDVGGVHPLWNRHYERRIRFAR